MSGDPLTFESAVQQRGLELLQAQTVPADCWKICADGVRRHYDLMSFPYRVFWGEHLHHGLFLTGSESPRQAQIRLLELCSTLANIRQRSNVLDVGCGYGGTAIYLARNFQCNVDGLTLSPKQARIARRKVARAGISDRVHLQVGDAERLNLNGQYDVIWVMESSEHFEDKARFFRKAAQLLKNDGKIVVAAWTASGAHPLVRELARLAMCPCFQKARDYARQVCCAGLEVTNVIDLSHNVLPTWEIAYRRVRRLRLLWPLAPAEIRSFVRVIPMMIDAYRHGLMAYSVLIATKG
jgi:tocopherol O-methyltransferase